MILIIICMYLCNNIAGYIAYTKSDSVSEDLER